MKKRINNDSSVKIGSNNNFGGDSAIGENAKIIKNVQYDIQNGHIDIKTAESKIQNKNSFQDLIANPATIASFVITLAGILLQFYGNFQYAVYLVIIGILFFIFLAILNSKKN